MKYLFLASLHLLFFISSKAQSVAINTDGSTANASALLDVKSTTKGMLVPRMDSAQRANIPSPSTALLIYQTDKDSGFYHFDGTNWQLLLNTKNNLWKRNGTNIYNHNLGNVGIGTINPLAKLHVLDSSVLFSASTFVASPGNPPVSGEGRRMMWYADKAAFRAGQVYNNNWNKDSTGLFSFATGLNTMAKGDYSIAMGYQSIASGEYSFAIGEQSIASGFGSVSLGGYFAKATGVQSLAQGTGSLASGSSSIALGPFANASGNNSVAFGYVATSRGERSIALGPYSTTIGHSSFAIGEHTTSLGFVSTAFGYQTTAIAAHSSTMGYYNKAKSESSLVIGRFNDTTNTNTLFEIGNGANENERNNAVTVITNGNVGIGKINPSEKLDVTGKIKTTNFQLTTGAGFNKILISDAGGNASWVDSTSIGNWSLNNGNIFNNNTGNVGIGTNNPIAKFHVLDSSVLFSAANDVPSIPNNTPISGAGRRMLWYPDKAAFRTGYVSGNNWDEFFIGKYSLATGADTRASGDYATAMGNQSIASATNAISIGSNTTASGITSVALGDNTTASGQSSIALGLYTTASGVTSTAMGNNTTASGVISTALGSLSTASGSYAIAMGYKDTASADFSMALGFQSKASEFNSIAIGYNTVSSGGNSIALGSTTTASGLYSTAMGRQTNAFGGSSTAIGNQTTAFGYVSTSLGNQTNASGDYSTAMGHLTNASGNFSIAMGESTTAFAINSTVMGYFNKAISPYSLVIGKYNDTTNTNSIFEVGNGTANNARSNAFTINNNGNIGIGITTPSAYGHGGTNKILEINNNQTSNNSQSQLMLSSDASATNYGSIGGVNWVAPNSSFADKRMAFVSSTFNATGGDISFWTNNNGSLTQQLLIEPAGKARIEGITTTGTNTNSFSIGGNGHVGVDAPGVVNGRFVILENGNTGIGTPAPTDLLSVNGTASKPGGGSWATFSDIRTKKNVTKFEDGLNIIKQLSPITFNYNEKSGYTDLNKTYIGFSAQDVEKIAPYMVQKIDDSKNSGLSDKRILDESALTKLLINAVKEQQVVIEHQQKQINLLLQKLK